MIPGSNPSAGKTFISSKKSVKVYLDNHLAMEFLQSEIVICEIYLIV